MTFPAVPLRGVAQPHSPPGCRGPLGPLGPAAAQTPSQHLPLLPDVWWQSWTPRSATGGTRPAHAYTALPSFC